MYSPQLVRHGYKRWLTRSVWCKHFVKEASAWLKSSFSIRVTCVEGGGPSQIYPQPLLSQLKRHTDSVFQPVVIAGEYTNQRIWKHSVSPVQGVYASWRPIQSISQANANDLSEGNLFSRVQSNVAWLHSLRCFEVMASPTSWVTVIGPVTSIFTALTSCTTPCFVQDTRDISISWLLLGRDCGYNQYTNCMPPSSSRLYTAENELYLLYHSPAICPAGYTAACSSNGLSSNSFTISPSLTIQLCCLTWVIHHLHELVQIPSITVFQRSFLLYWYRICSRMFKCCSTFYHDWSGWSLRLGKLGGHLHPARHIRVHQYLNGSQHRRHCCLGSNRNCRLQLVQ